MMTNEKYLFHLESHPTARSQAVTSSPLVQGTIVLSILPIATVLLESEKGRRCDSCLRARVDLRRCTACKNYWYCDSNCQMISWKAHHRRLCKRLLVFTSSAAYKILTPSERLHSILLTHLLTEHATSFSSAFLTTPKSSQEDVSDPISTMLSLLPQHNYRHTVPTVMLGDPAISELLMATISSRFANNNFTIHCARTTVFAHGVFPLASRSFNHSCMPSAVPVYRHAKESRCVTMEIKLLRDMAHREEITIPYMDPALPHSIRQSGLQLNYGFQCECSLCCQAHLSPYPLSSYAEAVLWESGLRERLPSIIREKPTSLKLRQEFPGIWHPSYLPSLAEAFSSASHDGRYDMAIQKGATLLAVYIVIYPSNFPMIGLHALELAKTCWNAFVNGIVAPGLLRDIDIYLNVAEQTFSVIFGNIAEEEEEPISELKLLRAVLKDELARAP